METFHYPSQLQHYEQHHGHICFGLAIGYRAGKCAETTFSTTLSKEKEELVLWLQSGGCAQEGIELVTPCTCEVGNLIEQKRGKFVFTFYHRVLTRSLRLVAKPEIMNIYQPIAALKAKIRNKTATDNQVKRFWDLNNREVQRVLEMPENELFYIQDFEMALLVKLNPFEAVYVPKSSCTCPEEFNRVPVSSLVAGRL